MKVEIWSDYGCPFCYMGLVRFREALERFPWKDEVEVFYRSYELDREREPGRIRPVAEMLMDRYKITREQALGDLSAVAGQGAALGLSFRFEGVVSGNTFDAHRLAHLAAESGHGDVLQGLLFEAHFTRCLDLEDHGVLTSLALEAGLEESAVRECLGTDRYGDDVRLEELQAENIGVKGVPFFLFDDRLAVPGSQESGIFLEALEKVRSFEVADAARG